MCSRQIDKNEVEGIISQVSRKLWTKKHSQEGEIRELTKIEGRKSISTL